MGFAGPLHSLPSEHALGEMLEEAWGLGAGAGYPEAFEAAQNNRHDRHDRHDTTISEFISEFISESQVKDLYQKRAGPGSHDLF